MQKIRTALKWIRENGLYPEPPLVQSPHKPRIRVNDKDVLMFATNNYLGMTTDERVRDAAIEGVTKWGIGNGSARLLTGNLEIHNKLEQAIAKFKNRPAGLTFVSGYGANEGAIQALATVFDPSILGVIKSKILRRPETVIFSDQLNHASIIAGVRLSGANKEIYLHKDINDLESKLSRYSKSTRKMIVTDGVFSMDGDVAPLPDILELAKKYGASVYLDDAHATGILGPHGRGVEDFFGVEGACDVVMGTFTKAFGGVGGFVVADEEIIDYIRIMAGSFIFTAPIAPPVVYGLTKAIEIVSDETWRREKVLKNADYLREHLIANGFDTYESTTQIVPIKIGDEKKAIQAAKLLLEEHSIFIPAARWPAVGSGDARLRTTVCTDHETDQIDTLITALRDVRNKVKF